MHWGRDTGTQGRDTGTQGRDTETLGAWGRLDTGTLRLGQPDTGAGNGTLGHGHLIVHLDRPDRNTDLRLAKGKFFSQNSSMG